MVKEVQYAFAQVVLRDREQIVLLRPMGKVLAMTFLNYAEAVKDPVQFESEVSAVEVDPKELEDSGSASRYCPTCRAEAATVRKARRGKSTPTRARGMPWNSPARVA